MFYTCHPLTQWNAFVNVEQHTPSDPQNVQKRNTTTIHVTASI